MIAKREYDEYERLRDRHSQAQLAMHAEDTNSVTYRLFLQVFSFTVCACPAISDSRICLTEQQIFELPSLHLIHHLHTKLINTTSLIDDVLTHSTQLLKIGIT